MATSKKNKTYRILFWLHKMLYSIFQNLIVKGIIIMYLDNILIFTQILEKYNEIVYKILKVCYKPTSKISKTSIFWLLNRTLAYLDVLLYLWLFIHKLTSCVSPSGNLLPRLLVILALRNYLYNVFLVILYTTIALIIV